MRRPGAVLAALALLVAAPFLSACSGDSDAATGLHGTTVSPPFVVPATDLTDDDGQPFSLTTDTTKPLTLVFFGYTHCPDVCQIVMSSLASAMLRLSSADRKRVDVIFVTTDPGRDTPAVLKRYLDHINPDFIGLTGDLKTIVAIGRPLGVGVSKGAKLPGGGYDVTHGSTILAIDSHDQGPVFWDQDTTAGEFAADIHTLLEKAAA